MNNCWLSLVAPGSVDICLDQGIEGIPLGLAVFVVNEGVHIHIRIRPIDFSVLLSPPGIAEMRNGAVDHQWSVPVTIAGSQ